VDTLGNERLLGPEFSNGDYSFGIGDHRAEGIFIFKMMIIFGGLMIILVDLMIILCQLMIIAFSAPVFFSNDDYFREIDDYLS